MSSATEGRVGAKTTLRVMGSIEKLFTELMGKQLTIVWTMLLLRNKS